MKTTIYSIIPGRSPRAAAAVAWVSILLLPFLSGCTRQPSSGHAGADSTRTAKDRYVCPMHPSVVSDHPGVCPVCNMALVKQAEQKEMNASESALLRWVSLSPSQRVMANVATTPVSRRSIARRITAAGVLDVPEPDRASITARFRGRVEHVLVNVTGSRVRKGQPLLDMYSPDLITAQREYLVAIGGTTTPSGDASIDESRQQMAAAARDRLRIHYGMSVRQIADLEEAGRVNNTSTLFAPIAGTILAKQVVQGQYVDEGAPLYSIADLSSLWAYIEVYENDIRFVHNGQRVKMTLVAYPGETFAGRVSFVDPVMNAESRTVRVRVDVPNGAGRLKPQMYVDASIDIASGEVLAVPASAVLQTGRRNVVWIETEENRFEQRNVVLGAQADGWFEVRSGVSEGDMVVATGGYLIDSESLLRMPAGVAEATNRESAPQDGGGAEATHEESGGQGGNVREIRITVDYAYQPDRIELRKGEKVRLLFYRKEDSECTEEVVFTAFGIRKKLPAFKTTAIEITPRKAGRFRFACGMDMVEGMLVVK